MEFLLFVFVAIFLEKLVEHIQGHWSWINLVVYLVAIVVAAGFDLRFFEAAGYEAAAWLDYGLTGLMVGSGSSFVHDILAIPRE